ncbi:MAG: flavodoxin-dependent (E)-4-hydroxy-3-methylbut-2-enyl-diphosphate synthase, partial [Candidatus Omnitrophica bacterium]|nr:flavodoxin-dependent (E)-4-hydroxy-3-methylbut-2-enyl-diphosphate synthase [Candidatus Omnitrophota bacterium]
MKPERNKKKVIKIGNVLIGGNNPIAIQAMTKTRTSNVRATLKQIKRLEDRGAEIVRLAVNDLAAAKAIRRIKKDARVPLVADIHFDWRLAVEAIKNGIDKIRLNPANIAKKDQIKEIVKYAHAAKIPIRIGVNSGSLKNLNKNKSLADNMVKNALDYIKLIEDLGFDNLVISLKAADIFETIQAYRKISTLTNYPLHLGLTATGLSTQGAIKSAIVLGILLSEGIGDTIRVSLTAGPEEEVMVAKYILQALGLRKFGPEVISCPTCGRCAINLVKIVRNFESKLSTVNHQSLANIKIALMGCSVNGPGEAKQADMGIAFEKQGTGIFFK